MTNLPAIKRSRYATRLSLFVLWAIIFAITSNLALAAQSNRLALAPSEDVQLIYAEGQITMNGDAIDIGTVIPDNALIKTGKGAVAEITFKSKNIIRIGENTSIRLNLSKLARTVDLQQGTFTAVLHKLDKLSGGSLVLKTPLANGGVRGTSFCARVEPNGYTYFCSCNGSLSLQDTASGSPFNQSGAHHNGIWFTKDGSGIKAKPAGLEYHSDKDLETLAARIGDTMDWTTLEH